MKKQYIHRSFSVGGANLYNKLVRYYNRSRQKLQILVLEEKNFRKQDILRRRILRLFKTLMGLRSALKLGMSTAAFGAGMMLFQPNPAQAQIAFGTAQTNSFGLTDVGYYSTPAFADLDGDGDMDMMSGEYFGDFIYFQNIGTAEAPVFTDAQINPFGLSDIGYSPAPAFADIDGDGDLDIISGEFYGTFISYENVGSVTAPSFSDAQVNPFGLTGYEFWSTPAFVDLDADGDLDMMAGSFFGDFRYFKNIGTGTAPAFSSALFNPFGLTELFAWSTPTFADLDGDGDSDMMSGEYSGDFFYFQNTGTAIDPAFSAPQTNPFGLTGIGIEARLDPAFVDLDSDGDMDLMSGEYYGNFVYFRNNTLCFGATVFPDEDGDSYGDAANPLFVADCIVPDGYVYDSTDCNDNSAAIHPDACDASNGNGIDDNCDGIVDNGFGAFTYYTDADDDGYGTGNGTSLCSNPGTGYSTNNTDCNDASASINPAAIEIFNGIDDNCNGIIDDITCALPTNLSVSKITGTSAKLKWNAVAGAEGYKVRYKVANTSEWKNGVTYHNSKPISGLLPNTVYKWEVETFCQISPNIVSGWSSKKEFTTGSLRVSDESIPQSSFQIYPNPTSGLATIQFSLPQASHIYIKVYDLSGKEIETLMDEDVAEGEHSLLLNTNHFPKGVYLVKMISPAVLRDGIVHPAGSLNGTPYGETQKLIVQ